MIPFIDIMLVLLAVVLTTATFVAQGKIPVTLPEASDTEPVQMEDRIEITVSEAGDLFIGDEGVSAQVLAQRIAGLGKQTQLLLRVDERAAFRQFVLVIDLLKAEQLGNVSIVTGRSGGGP